jgi:hypothetical protein
MKRINTAATVALLATFPVENINEELTARGATPTENAQAGATLLAMGCRTLDEVAATVVNLSKGEVTGEELTGYLKKAFPEHKIGERHGPHYLSLSRTGSLSGNIECRYTAPKAGRKVAKAASFDLTSIEDKQLAAMAKSCKGTALEALVTAEVAKREAAKAK